MILWHRVTDEELVARVTRLKSERLTYPEVQATQGELPAGYRHDHYERTLGSGDGVWDRAKADVMAWTAHKHAGVRVVPNRRPARGDDVLLAFTVGPVQILAPCRIVQVVNEEHRVGFVYGTLRGHPERGEESFMVERLDDASVRFVITAFSRPDELLVRLGGPIGRQIQRRVSHQYLEGLATASPS